MRVSVFVPTLFTEEGHQHHPRHVERGDAGAQQRGPARHVALDTAAAQRGLDDGVLGEEAGERRHADDREVSEPERDERDWQRFAQAAVAAHVLLFMHRVNDRAGAQEQSRLEEAVREQVHDREGVAGRAEAGGQHHVADLAHRRRRQRALDVVLGAADERAEEQSDGADDDDG